METDDTQTQGRIVTENPDLLALLRENTRDGDGVPTVKRKTRRRKPPHRVTETDQQIQRVYVDSPVSVHTDDEYQFVSPDVEDLGASVDFISPEEKTWNQPQHNSEHYQDHNTDLMSYSSALENYHDADTNVEQDVGSRIQYIVQSRQNPNIHPGIGAMQQHEPNVEPPVEPVRIIKPIQSPLSKVSRQEQEELLTLQQEQEYQQQLRDKILQQSKKTDEIQIPRLALETLDDEEKPKHPKNPLHDSLEDEYIVGDSLEERQSKSLLLKTQQEVEQLKQQQMYTQQQLQLLQQQQQEYVAAQQQVQQQGQPSGEDYDGLQDSLDQPQGSMSQFYQPGDYQVSQQGHVQEAISTNSYYLQQDQPQVGATHGCTNKSQGYALTYQEDNGPAGQLDPNNQIYDAGYQHVTEPYAAANAQHYVSEELGHPKYADQNSAASAAAVSPRMHTSSKSPMSHASQYLPPKQDYIKRNREELVKGPQRPGYKKLFATKKELKERPLLPSKLPTPQRLEGSSKHSNMPQSMEDLWAVRAQRLDQEKQKKLAQGKKRSMFRKYPSESKVDSLPESAASIRSGPPGYGGQRPPHYIQPIQQRGLPAQHSIAEPVRSEINYSDAASPDAPIRHTIITEDGQRLSVDINLKLMSPKAQPGQQWPPVTQQPQYATEAKMQDPPTSYQQNPMAYRAHVPPANQQQMRVQPDQRHSPQHQVELAGYHSNLNVPHPQFQMTGYERPEEYLNQPDVISQHTTSPHPSVQSTTPVSNPYKVLPAIASADTEKDRGRQAGRGNSSPGTTNNGSYMAQYKHHQNKKPEYKVYTLEDYRKLKKEISLGGLGPDIENETIKEKREKRQRQLEYAKSLKQHPSVISSGRSRSSPAQGPEEDDTLDKRKVALEYAKSVPKPKPRQANRDRASGKSSLQSAATGKSVHQTRELEIINIEKLQERHEKERQQVALMRQNLENYSQA